MLRMPIGLIVVLVLTASCVERAGEQNRSDARREYFVNREKPQSMVSILAMPDYYDGEEVMVAGVLSIGNDGDAVYLSTESLENYVFQNAIVIALSHSEREAARSLSGAYVLVEGTYNAQQVNLYSGYINDIRRLEPWIPSDAFSDRSAVRPE